MASSVGSKHPDRARPRYFWAGRWQQTLVAGVLGLSCTLTLGALPAASAEKLNLSYPPFPTLTVPVNDFEAFAQNGTLTPTLKVFAQLATPEQLSELQRLLRQRFKLTPTLINQFASTQSGQLFFRRMGDILKTSSNENGAKALQQAFVAASADPEGVTVLSLMRRFPDQSIRVDGKSGFQAVSAAVKLFSEQNAIMASLEREAATAPTVDIPTQPNLQQLGTRTWQVQTLTYQNPGRLSAMRTLTADIYLPESADKPAPLIVISHGVASNRATFTYLANHLASHGFAVAAVQHPGSDSKHIEQFLTGQLSNDPAMAANEMANRPIDIKLLIDEIQRRTVTQPAWRARVNPQQVGVIGQSLGGYTALATGGATLNMAELRQECPKVMSGPLNFNLSLPLQCNLLRANVTQPNLRDPRVKAVLVMNPISSLLFGERGMRQVQVPTMIVAGSEDIFAPPMEEQILPFSWLPEKNRYLLTLRRGTHFSFLGTSQEPGVFPVPPELVGPDPQTIHPAMRSISMAFFSRYLADKPEYASFLNQSYIQTLAPEPFSLSLLTGITSAQLKELLVAPPPTQSQSRNPLLEGRK
jgi:predicted dienelactone hydrolase